jgi:hypothetical protein
MAPFRMPGCGNLPAMPIDFRAPIWINFEHTGRATVARRTKARPLDVVPKGGRGGSKDKEVIPLCSGNQERLT